MTLEEKKERLIAMEWEDFRNVNNEGGKADCQENPGTFHAMRKSQFAPWPESVVDSYMSDLEEAKKQGRNLPAEKYAWMMESTAPEAFARISHLLPVITEAKKDLIERIAALEVGWMGEYYKTFPHLSAGNRPLTTAEDEPDDTSFETYLRGELKTYSEWTLAEYWGFLEDLQKKGQNLAFLTMEAMVKEYGYPDLKAADEAEAKRWGRS